MDKKALFFRSSTDKPCDLETLMNCCRQEGFVVEDHGNIDKTWPFDIDNFSQTSIESDLSQVSSQLAVNPSVLFIPAAEEDCHGVKVTQAVQDQTAARVVVMYSPKMPSPAYLCLAFRQGVDDVVTLDSDQQTAAIHVRRADRLLQARASSLELNGRLHSQIEDLHRKCEKLQLANARWQERLLALSSTAIRMAIGELKIAESGLSVLVVSGSNSQAFTAAELAQQLGFQVRVAHSGKDALKLISEIIPDVILTDATLPDTEVIRFAPTVRKAVGNKPLAVIAWSSNIEKEDKLLMPGAGIDDFVLKTTSKEGTSLVAAALLGTLSTSTTALQVK